MVIQSDFAWQELTGGPGHPQLGNANARDVLRTAARGAHIQN
jgi:hypothetical protein